MTRKRMVAFIAMFLMAASFTVVAVSEAAMACPGGTTSGTSSGKTTFGASSKSDGCREDGSDDGSKTDIVGGTWHKEPVCEYEGGPCPEVAKCADGTSKTRVWHTDDQGAVDVDYWECSTEEPPEEVDPVAAFEKVPLPASVITVQPPDGETLVNLPTILSTSAPAFVATVEPIKGQVISFTITASSFLWHHGDDTLVN